MASQVAEGFILLSANSLRGLTPAEASLLRAEMDKLLRDARAVVPPPDDAPAAQVRNRKIARISSAIQVISAKMMERR